VNASTQQFDIEKFEKTAAAIDGGREAQATNEL
jgi:hypothetical protein